MSSAVRSLVRRIGVATAALVLVSACAEQPTQPDPDVLFAKGGGGGPSVDAADPNSAPQDITLDVRVIGSGFDKGSAVKFLKGGESTPKIVTNSSTFIDKSTLIANITIAVDAEVALYDIEVTTRRGKKGIGSELFSVKEKGTPGSGDSFNYTITDLGTLAGGSWNVGRDISGNGEVVVGASEDANGNNVATVWSLNGTDAWDIRVLGEPLGFTSSEANAIDNSGIVTVGSAGSGTLVPVRWDPEPGILPALVVNDIAFPNGVARDVNTAGQIVGMSQRYDENGRRERRATLWDASGARDLGIVGGTSGAEGINEDGLVVGVAHINGGFHAVLWRKVTAGFEICDLHPGDASSSRAYAITDAKPDGSVEVAGVRDNIVTVWLVTDPQACVAAVSRDLSSGAYAFDINNSGVAVGQDLSSGTVRPVLWTAGQLVVELPSLKGNYGSADGINDAGQIVGWSAWSKGGRNQQIRAVVWTKNN